MIQNNQKHSFHLVDSSSWSIIAAFSVLMLAFGGVLYFHGYAGDFFLVIFGFCMVLFMMSICIWIKESVLKNKDIIIQFVLKSFIFFFLFYTIFSPLVFCEGVGDSQQPIVDPSKVGEGFSLFICFIGVWLVLYKGSGPGLDIVLENFSKKGESILDSTSVVGFNNSDYGSVSEPDSFSSMPPLERVGFDLSTFESGMIPLDGITLDEILSVIPKGIKGSTLGFSQYVSNDFDILALLHGQIASAMKMVNYLDLNLHFGLVHPIYSRVEVWGYENKVSALADITVITNSMLSTFDILLKYDTQIHNDPGVILAVAAYAEDLSRFLV
jgi:hypothetical protein